MTYVSTTNRSHISIWSVPNDKSLYPEKTKKNFEFEDGYKESAVVDNAPVAKTKPKKKDPASEEYQGYDGGFDHGFDKFAPNVKGSSYW
jgi:hypothetical protein